MKIYSFLNPVDPNLLPLALIERDWYGAPFHPPVRYGFGLDPERFHFCASHEQPASCHPSSQSGVFQAELWKYDVAEFFLTDPVSGHYLEFNLAPNGGWWSCLLTEPLQRRSEVDHPLPGVTTSADASSAGWLATASVPLDWLVEHLHFGPESRLNATFILGSPAQRFLSAFPLGGGEPAFHRPHAFPPLTIVPGDC